MDKHNFPTDFQKASSCVWSYEIHSLLTKYLKYWNRCHWGKGKRAHCALRAGASRSCKCQCNYNSGFSVSSITVVSWHHRLETTYWASKGWGISFHFRIRPDALVCDVVYFTQQKNKPRRNAHAANTLSKRSESHLGHTHTHRGRAHTYCETIFFFFLPLEYKV